MAITKKGNSLRAKAGLRNSKASLTNKIAELQGTNDEEYHENPFLKLLKISKKDKQITKSNNFSNKMQTKVSFNLSDGISKSSLRRRKRKAKEELKPKMNELLQSLPKSTTDMIDSLDEKDSGNEITPKKYINTLKKQQNLPNASKQSGHKKILINEHANFNKVLNDSQFKQSPFSALKNAISQNIESGKI